MSQQALRVDARRNVERILTAAIQVLTEDPAASMEQIAAASDVHRTTIYRRFPTREALIDSLLRRELEDAKLMVSGTGRAAPSESALRDVCAGAIAITSQYAFLLDHTRPRQLDAASARLYAKLLAHYQDAGILREDRPARWLAGLFGAMIVAVVEARHYMGLDDAEAADLLAQTFLDAARTTGADRRSS
jgi:AcrR family transcriptional regulator